MNNIGFFFDHCGLKMSNDEFEILMDKLAMINRHQRNMAALAIKKAIESRKK